MLNLFSDSKGQTIIEAVIALAIAVIVVSSITVAVITSVNNSDFSKNQNLATQYSQQGMEFLRKLSGSDWATFASYEGGTYCLGPDNKTLVQGPCTTPNINNFFIRTVTIGQDGSCNGVATNVTVSVNWSDGKCTGTGDSYCHSAEIDSCIANLNSTTP